MPLVIPPFVQYSAPLFPLRNNMRKPPPELDKFVTAELVWGSILPAVAVQFALSGNSPLALSQIAALAVDNTRSGSDVTFIFPDSGFSLVVPQFSQGVFPVFTNALMFYAVASSPIAGDFTVFQVFNSMPPVLALQSSQIQSSRAAQAVDASVIARTAIIPAGISGILESVSMSAAISGAATPSIWTSDIEDGSTPVQVFFSQDIVLLANQNFNGLLISENGLQLRFLNGVFIKVTAVAIGSPSKYNVALTYRPL